MEREKLAFVQKLKLFIAVGADKSAKRVNKYLPSAYGSIVTAGEIKRTFWGYGAYKDTTVLFAEAINAALAEYVGEVIERPDENHLVEVIVQSPKFFSRLDTHYDSEIKGKADHADERGVWKKAVTIAALFNISDARKPQTPSEEEVWLEAKKMQEVLAGRAISNVPANHAGLYSDGTEPPEGSL